MTIVPVILFAFIASMLASFFFKDISGDAGDNRMPAFWQMSDQRNELIAGVKFMARADPDRFADIGFLQKTDEQLNRLQTGMVVKKNGGTVYSSPSLGETGLDSKLQRLEEGRFDTRWGKNVGGRFTGEKFDLAFGDGSTGAVYLLSDASLFFNGIKMFFPLMVLSLLLVIVLTNGILTYFVSRSLIKPIYALKSSAEQFKEGDLSREVNLRRSDEIGELGAAFEQMRRRLNESIRLQLQYEENRKELISSISHDLQTPIAGIKACVEGIRDGIADTGPKREKYMSMISRKTDELERLIDELFLFSKLDLKRLPFHQEPLDLAAYLRNCAEELQADPRMEGVKVAFSNAAGGPVQVMADSEKLHRVILNIVENSLKYMNKAHPEIKLELLDEIAAGMVTVKIADNGKGIEDTALPHIFDRFYRADPSRNRATGGSGLGLAIVKQMIEGQGGAVWAESRMGEGTDIYFTLPKTGHGGERS
jgi:signal transduction histidine kinase